MSKTIYVDVLKVEQYETGFPPQKIAEFTAWWSDIVKKIPEEYLDSGRVEIDGVDSYGSAYANVHVYYSRPMNEEELKDFELRAEWEINRRKEERMRTFEALKKEFGE